MSLMMEELTHLVARLACQAYWRGKLEEIMGHNPALLQKTIDASIDGTWREWVPAAEMFIGLCPKLIEADRQLQVIAARRMDVLVKKIGVKN